MRHKEKELDDLSLKLATMEKENKNLAERTYSMNDLLEKKSLMFERTDSNHDQAMRQVGLLQREIGALNVHITELERSNDRSLEQQKKFLKQKE